MVLYLELAGRKETADKLAAAFWANLDIAGTRLETIRDPFQHIIRPMLDPVPVGKIYGYETVFYSGEFYGSQYGAVAAILFTWDPAPSDTRVTSPAMLPDATAGRWQYGQNDPITRFIMCKNKPF